jgi:hypothetical protein
MQNGCVVTLLLPMQLFAGLISFFAVTGICSAGIFIASHPFVKRVYEVVAFEKRQFN